MFTKQKESYYSDIHRHWRIVDCEYWACVVTPSVMWNLVILCLCKISYSWVQGYFQRRNGMKSGMRVLFSFWLDVTCTAKYINGNKIQCMMLLKCSLCCSVTGLQYQAGTTRFPLAQKTQTSPGAYSVSCAGVSKGSFTRVKWPACEAHHSYLVPRSEWVELHHQTLLHYWFS
jgi:hypothetical protein